MNGKILDTVTVGNSTLAMKYDSNGLRTKKGSIKYYYDSSNNLIGMVNGSNTLLFYYDESGSPTSFSHKGTMYFYIKNLQGDICKIVDASGSIIANYAYDAWGKLLSVKDANGDSISNLTDAALLNPLRYRGYVYDEETGLYYLQSRYYDPTIGRFLNADVLFDTESGSPLSTNMFAYCENNPLLRIDREGNEFVTITITLIGIGIAACFTSYTVYKIVSSDLFNRVWKSIIDGIGQSLSVALASVCATGAVLYTKAREIAQSVAKSFAKVKSQPKYRTHREYHHIVAKGAKNAKEAQKALRNLGINYKTDSRNLIFIKTGLHRRLHTNTYYAYVNTWVVQAYNKGKSKSQKYANVLRVLNGLRRMIDILDKAAPF